MLHLMNIWSCKLDRLGLNLHYFHCFGLFLLLFISGYFCIWYDASVFLKCLCLYLLTTTAHYFIDPFIRKVHSRSFVSSILSSFMYGQGFLSFQLSLFINQMFVVLSFMVNHGMDGAEWSPSLRIVGHDCYYVVCSKMCLYIYIYIYNIYLYIQYVYIYIKGQKSYSTEHSCTQKLLKHSVKPPPPPPQPRPLYHSYIPIGHRL